MFPFNPNKAHPRPWNVRVGNVGVDCEYHPVDIIDSGGTVVLRVGHDLMAHKLAMFIVDEINFADTNREEDFNA